MSRLAQNEVSNEVEELLKINNETIEEELEPKEKHLKIVNEIVKLSGLYTELESYLGSLSDQLSDLDLFQEDLLHYVEERDFTPTQALKFVNFLKKKRKERRIVKQDMVIRDEFHNKKNRFDVYNQREMFLIDIYKKEKTLQEHYKPRKISFNEIDEIISSKKGKKEKIEV